MEFPAEWVILESDDFNLAITPRDPGDLGIELMVQVRASWTPSMWHWEETD